ncbi:MAG: hypothetical protein CMJ85_11735 [Planctomycetes bacterium]|nr:hypothetical protein [Planctomycetota bacterium]
MFCAMLALTWRTWPDAMVDFGRELYVPWRIVEGQRLFSELAYHNGPLSPHVNALWFSLFGVSLSSLLWLNGLVLVGVTLLMRALLRQFVPPGGATVGTVTFVALFGFGQYVAIGNYNWMCPYSHEVTHGIAAALLALCCLSSYARSHRLLFAFGGGAAIGLAFLTKAEVFVAGAAAAGLGFLLVMRARARDGGSWRGSAALALVGLALPPCIAFGALAATRPIGDALTGTLGTWAHLAGSRIGEQSFFAAISGLDDPIASMWLLTRWSLIWCGVLVLLASIGRLLPERLRTGASLALAASSVAGAVWVGPSFPDQWLRPLPLLLAVVTAQGLARAWRTRSRTRADVAAEATRVAFTAFALLLLVKVLLHVRVGHYGFGLAMPGTALLAAWVLASTPLLLARWVGASLAPVRIAAIGLSIGLAFCHVALTYWNVAAKPHTVGTGSDRFMADTRGLVLQAAKDWLEDNTAVDATLTVFVDCEILNYIARRRNPIPFGNFNPHQVRLFGEATMIAALNRDPPDIIALIQRDTSEYGARFFSQDYGRKLAGWIRTHYAPVGPPPSIAGQTGAAKDIHLRFWRRKP